MDSIDEAISFAGFQIIRSLDLKVGAVERERGEPMCGTFPQHRHSSMYMKLEQREAQKH